MLICKVVGHVWATKKEESLNGLKLMVVKPAEDCKQDQDTTFVAVDIVGAGIGEKVLTVSGSAARKVFGNDNVPIDSVIVGIVDSIESV